LTGRVSVKLRARDIEQYASVLGSGDPVLVSGKVSFPQRSEEADDDSEREPTVLLNEAQPLCDAVRADTRSMTLRVPIDRARPAHLAGLARVMAAAKGTCPVALHLSFPNGAEAILPLGEAWRVEVGDTLLSGIERVFGEQLAELR
jgi:DNA polymerase-3 subunit alpha